MLSVMLRIPRFVRYLASALFVLFLLLAGSPAQGQEAAGDPGVAGAVAIVRNFTGASASSATVAQSLLNNRVDVRNVMNTDLISGSVFGNTGILTVNQASGDVNNQANVYAIALVEADSLLQKVSIARSARLTGNTLTTGGGSQENRIENSFGGSNGIIGVNQSAGNLNQQANVMVVGIGLVHDTDLMAVGDTDLGAVSADNNLIKDGPETAHSDVITGSFTGFRGVAQVSQTSGDLNSVGNVLGISYQVLGATP